MDNATIQRIADLAGVDYATAYDWIVDPNGDWQNAAEPVSKDEHDAWIESASIEEIANWIAAGQ